MASNQSDKSLEERKYSRTLIILWVSFLFFVLGLPAGYLTASFIDSLSKIFQANTSDQTTIASDYETLKTSRFGAGSGENLDLVKELGAHWVRFPTDVDSLGSDPRNIDFSDLDRRVKKVQENQILLFGSFNRGGRHSPQRWPAASRFAEYFSQIVERYDGDQVKDMPGLVYPITHWEVLNEAPSLPNQDLVPQIYADYLKESVQALKAACSSCLLSPGGIPGPISQEFLEETLKLSPTLSSQLDFSNWHTYSAPFLGKTGEKELSAWLTKWGFGQKEKWSTEIAADTPEEIVKLFAYQFGQGMKVGIFSEFYSAKGGGGLVSASKEKQPSFTVFKTLIKKIDYFTKVDVLGEEWDVQGQTNYLKIGQYKFEVGGRLVYLLWGGQLPLEIKGTVTVTDIFGNETKEEASNISLADSPILIN